MLNGEWININNRLPHNTNDVLVIDDTCRMHVSCYFFVHDMWIWEQRDDQLGMGKVTHWMPLPLPPKEEQANDK